MLGFIVALIACSPPIQQYASLPDELHVFSGDAKDLSLGVPVYATGTVKDPEIVQVNGSADPEFEVVPDRPISLKSRKAGRTEMQLKLFGKIPFKTVKVDVVPDLKVIPGGQTIGVKLKSKGILVVGHHLVPTADGKVSPGEEAKLNAGDVILEMDGVRLTDVGQVSAIVQKAGKAGRAIDLVLQRAGNTIRTSIRPVYDPEDKAYRLGIYIRDSAAGVGTLTFYAPDQKAYGALGHVITDMDTQTPIPVGSGHIVHSNVTSIDKSQSGEPGEKRAVLIDEDKVLGDIRKNTEFGIFGKMYEPPDFARVKEPIPVAFADEVKEGPAHIYTVVSGQKVEKFDVEIVHVAKQTFPATKGMIIKITDPKLVEQTGGIVQGMSGSPIVQNGKLIGAVTHVFVNDPTSGYGCFIEWMLRDADILMDAPNPQAS